jgi:hypothetical protein
MVQFMRNAFEGAWLPAAERARCVAELDLFAAKWGVEAAQSAKDPAAFSVSIFTAMP